MTTVTIASIKYRFNVMLWQVVHQVYIGFGTTISPVKLCVRHTTAHDDHCDVAEVCNQAHRIMLPDLSFASQVGLTPH